MTFWFLARATGFVALLAATLTVALGAVGTASRSDRRILAQLVHRSAAIVTLAALAVHIYLLVADRYVDISIAGALLPFTAGYRATALGLGTLALHLFLVVSITGALRGRLAASSLAPRAWRAVHLSAYAAWALSMAHGVFAGTDTTRGWGIALYAGCALIVAAALVIRVVAAVRDHNTPLRRARRTPVGRTSASTSAGGAR